MRGEFAQESEVWGFGRFEMMEAEPLDLSRLYAFGR